MEDQYYIKKGRRYHPVEPYRGFPADGVWVVKDMGNKASLMLKIDPKPQEAPALAKRAQNVSYLQDIIIDKLVTSESETVMDLAAGIAETIIDRCCYENG